MKDSLFDILMNFFEKSLAQINKNNAANLSIERINDEDIPRSGRTIVFKPARDASIRVFTYHEQIKLTKASYQFIMRLMMWEIIATEHLEVIINQLIMSESRFVTLQETKWAIRNALAQHLDEEQLAFLDLVLYQKEDDLSLH